MKVATFEGVVDHGQIRLTPEVPLPEKARVFVVVPDFRDQRVRQIPSPRLVHPEQAADFEKEVLEVISDAEV